MSNKWAFEEFHALRKCGVRPIPSVDAQSRKTLMMKVIRSALLLVPLGGSLGGLGVAQQRAAGAFLDKGSLYRELVTSLDGEDAPTISSRDYLNVAGDLERSNAEGTMEGTLAAHDEAQALREQALVPLSILVSDWHAVDPAALEDGRVVFDGRSYRPSGSSRDIWKDGTTIAAGMFGPLVPGVRNTFVLPEKLLLGDRVADIGAIQLSFGDSWHSVVPGERLALDDVPSSDTGSVSYSVRVQMSGRWFVTNGTVGVVRLGLSVPCVRLPDIVPVAPGKRLHVGVFASDDTWSSLPTTIQAAATSGQVWTGSFQYLRNPLIYVPGIDFFNWNLADVIDYASTLITRFRDLGYDVIVVDYDDGTASIQSNGLGMKALIETAPSWVIPTRQCQPMVVVGESMGTQTARYALRTMEMLGQPHNVGIFMAIDGPFRGAHAPPCVLLLAQKLASKSAVASILYQYFLGDATRQLIRFYSQDPMATAYYDEAEDLGLPQDCVNYAVAKGALGVRLRPIGDIRTFAHLDYTHYKTVRLWPFRIYLTIAVWSAYLDLQSDHVGTVFDFNITVLGFPIPLSFFLPSSLFMDLAPGGTYSTTDIVAMYNQTSLASTTGPVTYDQDRYCFIPTFSALAIDLPGGFAGEANYSGSVSVSPFDAVYVPTTNGSHLAYDPGAVTWMAGRLTSFYSRYDYDCNDNGIPDPCEGINPWDCAYWWSDPAPGIPQGAGVKFQF